MKVNLQAQGHAVALKDYQAVAMKYLWSLPEGEGRGSKDVWEHCNKVMKTGPTRPSISRASVINFLNAMVDEEVLDYHETTGKGGHRRIYRPALTPMEFVQKLTVQAIKSLQSLAEELEALA